MESASALLKFLADLFRFKIDIKFSREYLSFIASEFKNLFIH